MDYFARQNLIVSKPAAELIKNIKILVVGVGAGGNELLKNLLLMGFGNLTIIDFDHVEDSNLSRTTLFRKEDIGKSKSLVAAERLREMALHSSPNIVGLHGNLMTDFGKGLFLEHDVVICCVDTQKARAYINDWCVLTRTPFFEMGFSEYDVDVSFFAPIGQMVQRDGKVIDKLPSSDGAFPRFLGEFPVCLREEIGYGSFDVKRNSCSSFKIRDTNLAKIPTIQVSAAMAGVLIATELVKYLNGIDTIRNKMLLYFGRTYETMICNYSRSPKCTIHDEEFDLMTINVAPDSTLEQILMQLQRETNSNVLLKLPDEYVISGKCHMCGAQIQFNKRKAEIWDDERWCENCKQQENYSHIIEYSNALKTIPIEVTLGSEPDVLSKKLSEVGVPENDILEVTFSNTDGYQCKYVYLKSI